MAGEPDDLPIKDSSGLTDADWAEINKLKRIYKEGGTKALWKAIDALGETDPIMATCVAGAFWPDAMTEAIKDVMADRGMTREDVQDLIKKLEGGSKAKH